MGGVGGRVGWGGEDDLNLTTSSCYRIKTIQISSNIYISVSLSCDFIFLFCYRHGTLVGFSFKYIRNFLPPSLQHIIDNDQTVSFRLHRST